MNEHKPDAIDEALRIVADMDATLRKYGGGAEFEGIDGDMVAVRLKLPEPLRYLELKTVIK